MKLKTYPCLIVFAALSLSAVAQAASAGSGPAGRTWESQYDFGGEFGGEPAMLESRSVVPERHGGQKAVSWESQYDFGGEFGGEQAMVATRSVLAEPSGDQNVVSWESQYDFGGEFGGEQAMLGSRNAEKCLAREGSARSAAGLCASR